VVAYDKPILLLVDDLTLSTAELLPMFMQDEGRGTVLGVRTGGGGGTAAAYSAGVYSEGIARITRSIFTRKRPVSTPGFPAVDHFQNVGIYPDIIADRLTRENLITGGKPFVDAFTKAVTNLIEGR
jgi:C-terminal processing protease CtpA/Prc